MMMYNHTWIHMFNYMPSIDMGALIHKIINCTQCGEFIMYTIYYAQIILCCMGTLLTNAH